MKVSKIDTLFFLRYEPCSEIISKLTGQIYESEKGVEAIWERWRGTNRTNMAILQAVAVPCPLYET